MTDIRIFFTLALITAVIYLIVFVIQLRQFSVHRLIGMKLALSVISLALCFSSAVTALKYYGDIIGKEVVAVADMRYINRLSVFIAAVGWLLIYVKFNGDK